MNHRPQVRVVDLLLPYGDFPRGHFGLGYTLYDLGRHREAYSHLRRYTELAPHNSWAWLWLGRAAARRGNETRYESLPGDFHARVRAGFLDIAAADPGRCVVIDATQGIETVASAIAAAVTARLKA